MKLTPTILKTSIDIFITTSWLLLLSVSLSSCATQRSHTTNTSSTIQSPQTKAHPDHIQVEIINPIPAIPPRATVDKTAAIKDFGIAPNNLWERLIGQLHLYIPENKRVRRSREWYLKRPKHLQAVTRRAVPFMYLIIEEVEKRKLPMELALLPMIESSFDPFAYSHGSASGVWQFTAPTAKSFGLKINWWYDGRRDVTAATTAALDMLKYLYDRLDQNWLYAIAAYNTGEGRIRRAIRKNKALNKPTDFWSLDLPSETKKYVPQLLALTDIIKNYEAYGVQLHPINNEPQVHLVTFDSQIDLAFAADLADMSLTDLHRLNPGFNRWATPPEGPHKLLLPVTKVNQFKEGLDKTTPDQRLKWIRYQIKPGDSLSTIAQQHQTTAEVIRTINKLDSNRIRAGKNLLILHSVADPAVYKLSVTEREKKRKATQRGQAQIKYVVQPGDSFWSIAQKYKTTARKIAYWNHMSPRDTLKVGKSLVIWQNKTYRDPRHQNHMIRKVNYRVRRGDSLSSIAHKFKVSMQDLKIWNHLDAKRPLKKDQALKIFVDVTKTHR
jgi:membrane-bound lytic murein transglycosylase D